MIRFITSGISTTIQDLGRYGYRKYGVPVSGAMDQFSAAHANETLGNKSSCAVLEMVVNGPILFFEEECWIALSGASIHAELGGKTLKMNEPIFISAGKELKLGNITGGKYAYLAVKGGIQSEIIMGSRSMFKGITQIERITKGMSIEHECLPFEPKTVKVSKLNSEDSITASRRVSKGPDFDMLTPDVQKALFLAKFQVNPDSNRTGTRLDSEANLYAPEIITSPVQPGIVQLTPSGQMIILGRDAGVTGGYARVFHLIGNQTFDVNYLIQFELQ